MTDRIALLLKAKNITASQFADEIGVQRSNISHVLSGRNKPSLEFIQKILKRYPEINPDWILFGKGPMNMEYNLFSELAEEFETPGEAIQAIPKKQEQLLTPERQNIAPPAEKQAVVAREEITVTPQQPRPEPKEEVRPEASDKTETMPDQKAGKQIEKVLVFFSNRTFREYTPE
ncbi:MAG TPA: helix-turn-helix transcriptional regulator [Bacteroidales bacterium]|nr:helix-turn-helix transcriptional regulator [Bacteroidales bacterium]HSA42635.1 helix-turn-helix transcriptional regulator [Bacteroidales bacterium]